MISIIIPFYKFTFFEETLQSLVNQTDKRFKVYIGDDASPESPAALLEKYNGQLDLIYQRFETNLGGISLVQQWDRCIALSADEEWLMILGDDDKLSPNSIEEFYKNQEEIKKSNCNVVRFATIEIDGNSQIISKKYTHPKFEKATDSFYRKFKHLTRSSLSEYIFSRKVYNKFGFFNYPLAWNSDDRAWLDFSDDKPIFSINESIVYFRLSMFNISGKADNKYLKNLSQISFYRFIIVNKFEFYTKHQKINFLRRYESQIRNISRLRYREWGYLFFYFLKYFDFKEFKKFIKRFLNTILRRHDY
jgi:glycosyltransferase involved in cell wall biosynthesis